MVERKITRFDYLREGEKGRRTRICMSPSGGAWISSRAVIRVRLPAPANVYLQQHYNVDIYPVTTVEL
jgi:hypothetical protein